MFLTTSGSFSSTARSSAAWAQEAGTLTLTGLLTPASTAAMFMLTTFSPFLA